MIGIARRFHLLAALALLLSGVLQGLADGRGATCARMQAPARAFAQPEHPPGEVAIGARAGGEAVAALAHEHAPIPQPGSSLAAVGCGVAALSTMRGFEAVPTTSRYLLRPGDPPPASLHARFLFRPPRLS